MLVRRTVLTGRDPEQVFAYLSDFTTTMAWDAGTVRTSRVFGDGGVGTRYHNVSLFRGRETELLYEVVDLEPPRRVVLRGENRTVVAQDTIEVTPRPGGGAEVVYSADFTLKGWAKIATPFLKSAFRRLGDDSARQLAQVLSD